MKAAWITLPIASAALAFAEGGFVDPGTYLISSAASSKVLEVDRIDQTSVNQFPARNTANQHWNIERAGTDLFFVRSARTGCALTQRGASRVECTRFTHSPGQQWRMEAASGGSVRIVSRQGRALAVPDGSSRDGVRTELSDRSDGPGERFILSRIRRGS
jgi:Ricin-type beta-trefoil lectin domain-like